MITLNTIQSIGPSLVMIIVAILAHYRIPKMNERRDIETKFYVLAGELTLCLEQIREIVRKQKGSRDYLNKIVNNINRLKKDIKYSNDSSYRSSIELEIRSLRRDSKRIFTKFFISRDNYFEVLALLKDKYNDLLLTAKRAEDAGLLNKVDKYQWLKSLVMTIYTTERVSMEKLKLKLRSLDEVINNKNLTEKYKNSSFFYISLDVNAADFEKGFGVWIDESLYSTINKEITSYELNHIVRIDKSSGVSKENHLEVV